ncbi:MAG: hypothetical protein JO220_20680 [Hyphomicrobiales bacterium]|nr:hypothetical protein [Hyphomicrobiales bacterium]
MTDDSKVLDTLLRDPSVCEATLFSAEIDGRAMPVVAVVPFAFASPPQVRSLALECGGYSEAPAVILCKEMPRLPDGRLDTAHLMAAAKARGTIFFYERAATELESQLVTLVENVLGISPAGVTDDLLDLGLDSLRAVHLTSALERLHPGRISLADLFELNTIRRLAAHIEGLDAR